LSGGGDGAAAGATGGDGAGSSPAGTSDRATGAPGGSLCTRAVGVPIVSALGVAGVTAALAAEAGAGLSSASVAFAAGAAEAVVAAAVTGAAVTAEPVADFARATGVLNSPLVEAITGAPAVAVFDALAAGAPASGFFGGAGSPRDESVRSADLNESRIFSAAAANCVRMCGICSKTVSAGSRSFISRGIKCWRKSP
jgi:hypothetical protein